MITLADIHRASILVVDDQEANVQLLAYLLSTDGYTRVDSTTDPRRVVAMHTQQRYDLIVLDLHMPGMNGFDVMEALKPLETESYLPVLVLTAEPARKVAALEAGARDFVTKPFDPIEVLTRIRNMLEVRLLHRESRQYGALLEETVSLRTAELQRFRSAMDATADAIFLIDTRSMALVDVNDGACRMLGYRREELLQVEPQMFGLASREQLEHQAASGRDPALVETELTGADLMTVPVEVYWQLQTAGATRLLIAVARDISERQLAQRRLKHLANYDSLTGLPNRAMFYQTLSDAIEMASGKDWRIVVLIVGLDRFKAINDLLGAAPGDELLRQFGKRLAQCVRVRDTVGRLGGDEFALILSMTRSPQDAIGVANAVRDSLRAPFDLGGREAALTASIGIAVYPDDAVDPAMLIKYANTAMARAKEAGRDGYRFFTPAMNVQVLARLELELALRRALDKGEFVLHYQPKVNLDTGRISGVEALMRWNRPGHGLVFPAEFIAVMEETGLIVRAGAWIIDAACAQVAAWSASAVGEVRVAVNVSSRQFGEGDLEGEIRRALDTHAIDPRLLELELTESALMSNAEHTIEVLGNLKALGISVAIDDFGTGYSSLAYLKRFPIDKLKIDIAFVREVTTNPDDAAIALAIIGMAHSLHMQVIAEGVETSAQMSYLGRNRCDEIQGFHFSCALPAPQVGDLVVTNRSLAAAPERAKVARQTLLIVDADPDALASLHRLFRRDTYRILTAGSPAEGFEQLALHEVQVIVCDQRMPVMSGTEFLSKVKELYPDTIRIILSGDRELESVLDSINRGAIYRFYTKPWDDTQLRDNVRLAFHHYWVKNGPKTGPRNSCFGTDGEAGEFSV